MRYLALCLAVLALVLALSLAAQSPTPDRREPDSQKAPAWLSRYVEALCFAGPGAAQYLSRHSADYASADSEAIQFFLDQRLARGDRCLSYRFLGSVTSAEAQTTYLFALEMSRSGTASSYWLALTTDGEFVVYIQ